MEKEEDFDFKRFRQEAIQEFYAFASRSVLIIPGTVYQRIL